MPTARSDDAAENTPVIDLRHKMETSLDGHDDLEKQPTPGNRTMLAPLETASIAPLFGDVELVSLALWVFVLWYVRMGLVGGGVKSSVHRNAVLSAELLASTS